MPHACYHTFVLPISKMAEPSALERTSMLMFTLRISGGRRPSKRRPSGLTNSMSRKRCPGQLQREPKCPVFPRFPHQFPVLHRQFLSALALQTVSMLLSRAPSTTRAPCRHARHAARHIPIARVRCEALNPEELAASAAAAHVSLALL